MFPHATHIQTEPTMRRSGTKIRRKPVTPSIGLSDSLSSQSTISDNFVTTNPDRFSNAMVRHSVQLPMQSNFYQYTPPSEYPPNPYTVGNAHRNPGYTEDPALDMPSPGKVGYGPEQTHEEIPDIDIGSPSSINSPVAVTPIVSEPPSAPFKYFNFESAQGLAVPAVVLVLSVVFWLPAVLPNLVIMLSSKWPVCLTIFFAQGPLLPCLEVHCTFSINIFLLPNQLLR